MGTEPDALLRLHVLDESFERDDTGTVTDHVRVHRQEEHRAFFPRLVELVDPDLHHVSRIHVTVSARVEERGVIEDPLDRKLDHAGGLAVLDEFIGAVVRHEGTLVQEADVPDNLERIRTVIPRRGSVADGARAGDLFDGVDRLTEEALFRLRVERGADSDRHFALRM